MLLLSFGAWTPTHNMEFAQHLMTTMREAQSNYEKLKHFTFFEDMAYSESDVNAAEKIDLALDIRPKAPHLVKMSLYYRRAIILLLVYAA